MRPAARALALACAALSLLDGCALRTTHPFDAAAARKPAGGPQPDVFAYDQPAQPIDDRPLAERATRTHAVRHLAWESSGDNGQPGWTVKAQYFQSRQAGPQRLVIVLPLWGTYTYPSQKIAEGVRDRGRGATHVLLVLGEEYLFDWDELGAAEDRATLHARSAAMSERMRTTVVDVRRLIDWAQAQPEIDAQRIGIVGFSMSAVVGGLVVGADERVQAAVLVMGGAKLHDIIARCDGPLQRVRDQVLPRLGLTGEQYHAIVEETWSWIDPERFPARIDPARILMFDARDDECMPQSARDAFWETLGEPRRISFHYGHKHSFLALTPLGLNYMRRQIYRFLDATL